MAEIIVMTLVETPQGILFMKRASHKSSPGKWAPPAGHTEPEDKDEEDSARRELWEETGYPRDSRLFPIGRVVNEKFDVRVYYMWSQETRPVVLSDEHTASAYVLRGVMYSHFAQSRTFLQLRSYEGPKTVNDYTKTSQQLAKAIITEQIKLPSKKDKTWT